MLILSLKRGEQVRIGDDIIVMVTDIGSVKVRIGVEAPREIPVQRVPGWEQVKVTTDRQ